jgi:hypothetical protein
MGSSVTNPSRTYVTLTLSHRGVIVQVRFRAMEELRYATMLGEYNNQTKQQDAILITLSVLQIAPARYRVCA